MLHAFLNRKITQQINEDTLTSSVIGMLSYLPAYTFWKIFRRAIIQYRSLPKYPGVLKSIEFWPKWNPSKTSNTNYVEPDVLLNFEEFAVIIEAKRYDAEQHYENQWKRECQAFLNENEDDKPFFFIALGVSNSLKKNTTPICVANRDIEINKCSWKDLLQEIATYHKELVEQKTNSLFFDKHHELFLLDDIISLFASHGFYINTGTYLSELITSYGNISPISYETSLNILYK